MADLIYDPRLIQFVLLLQSEVVDYQAYWIVETRNTDLTRDQYEQLSSQP